MTHVAPSPRSEAALAPQRSIVRSLYRARQFFWALRPRLSAEDELWAQDYLSPTEHALFRALPPVLRRHCLDVAGTLLAAGERDPRLIAAALLHDNGKAEGPVRLWHRVAKVLLAAVSPRLPALVASPRRGSWRYPLHVLLDHAAIGAARARAAGSHPDVVSAIAQHHAPPPGSLAAAIHSADERW